MQIIKYEVNVNQIQIKYHHIPSYTSFQHIMSYMPYDQGLYCILIGKTKIKKIVVMNRPRKDAKPTEYDMNERRNDGI